MNKKKRSFYISWLLVVLWMGVIFYFSAQPAVVSDGTSKGATRLIINFVDAIYPLDIETSTGSYRVEGLNNIIRKLGHFGEYLIFSMLLMNAFSRGKVRGWKLFAFSFLFCLLYAISDEVHQFFVPGRGPSIKDVAIDSIGGIFGSVIFPVVNHNN